MSEEIKKGPNFIRNMIAEDLASGSYEKIVTRFPPEPNGYLHIGHCKAICINFGLAEENEGGVYHLRFDDTNPVKEDVEYVDSIIEDIKWLGFDWGEHLYFASDYFGKLYEYAQLLIKKDRAFVCDLSAEDVKKTRGGLTSPGENSPCRNRSVKENLDLLERMKNGEFADGSKTVRAKIDMSSPNMNMRDPAIYRIRKFHHHRTGDKWCIYPMYDFAHCLSDAIEGITHSNCSLEFEDHRPLYDWFIQEVGTEATPKQTEFARLNIDYTVMSKRKLLELVEKKLVSGWDDPRMPTLSGMRRRGYTPFSIRDFCERIGVTKKDSCIELSTLENCIREDLNASSDRAMVVLDPLKVVITNYPEGEEELVDAKNHPQKPELGTRKVPFSREIYIERGDFMEDAPKKFFRLSVGREVRLKYAYYATCDEVIKDNEGNIVELRCTYDPETKGGKSADGRKVKGTIHWVSVPHAFKAPIRMYDRLFKTESPGGDDFIDQINPNSLVEFTNCALEPSLKNAKAGDKFQFERNGYFCVDTIDSKDGSPAFNRTVTLKDSWAKLNKTK